MGLLLTNIFFLFVGFCSGREVRIENGTEAYSKQFPYHVGIIFSNEFSCGGSIISPNYVLSAAHCAYLHNTTSQIKVASSAIIFMGSLTYGAGTAVNVSRKNILIHESYNGEKPHLYDICLLRTPNIQFTASIQPAHLPNHNQDFLGKRAIVTGWGATSVAESLDNIYPDNLQFAEVTVIENSACSWLCEQVGLVGAGCTESILCVSVSERKGSCEGDSGGPLAIKLVYDTFLLIGVLSQGPGDKICEVTEPTIYASVAYHLKWILSKIKT